MVNQQKIKKLAEIASEKEAISQDVQEYVLTVLGKQDLKIFLMYFKQMIDKKTVYVKSATEITNQSLQILKNNFDGKKILVEEDKSLGAGVKLKIDDMVVDFTIKNYINETIAQLKN